MGTSSGGGGGLVAVPVLLVTGPVGAGKTSVIEEIFDQLAARGVAHAVVDVDAVAMCWPSGAGDRFNQRMAIRNLAAVWRNYAAGGADRLVLARVLESRAELEDYRAAIPGADIRVCRLAASLPALRERVARRETGSSYESLVRRAAELAASMERSDVADFVVGTTGRTVRQAASEVLRKAGWTGAAG